jgi:hypothetical protein
MNLVQSFISVGEYIKCKIKVIRQQEFIDLKEISDNKMEIAC